MKTRILVLLITVFCLVFALVSCGDSVSVTDAYVNEAGEIVVVYSNGTEGKFGKVENNGNKPEIENTYVNDEMHLIVVFTDGTTKDLGYVGVEVEPPLYTVTFYDSNNNVIDTQEVYKGKGAKAPAAPEVADKVFVGWDKDYDNVTSDLELHPVYTNAAEYTVTFKDIDGTVLKTEKVISGHSATAPTVPNKSDKIFTGWDKSFSRVMSDLVVTAQYREKNTYTVTFKDYSGRVIDTVSVKEGDDATAPSNPKRDGYTFSGWSSSIKNVTSNLTVTAKYTLQSASNVFDISYKINSNNTITVTFAVKGSVNFCGLEGYVDVPAGLTYESLTQGDGATANFKDGKIYFMFASNNGQNVTKETVIMTVIFKYTTSLASVNLNTVVSDIYDQNYTPVSHKVVGKTITLK